MMRKLTALGFLSVVCLLVVAGCPAPDASDDGSSPFGDNSSDNGSSGGTNTDSSNPDGNPGGNSNSSDNSDGSGDGVGDGTGDDGAGDDSGSGSNGGNANGSGNRAPVASLSMSPAEGFGPGMPVTLDASNSSDPDDDPLTFEWKQTAGPAVSFSDASAAVTQITTPFSVSATNLQFEVTVRDDKGGSSKAMAEVSFAVADEFAGHPQSLLAYREEISPREAYHLLRRAQLGARPDEVALAASQPLNDTVAELLRQKSTPRPIVDLAAVYENDVSRRWLVHLIEGPNPLYERMAMFWHDRFATSRRIVQDWRDRTLPVVHWNMLRVHSMGNYRSFLEQLTLDPLMLLWLDGANSPKENPNENYAREFWELFTLGRDVLYTEEDIREAARGFTGITLLRQNDRDTRPIFDLLHHDETFKSVFPGRAAAANHNYQSIIELTLAQPEAPRYVARNLFVFFVHDHPSDAVVQELADQLVRNDFNIKPLVGTLLRSQAMFSTDARGAQIASPVEHIVGVARTLDTHMHREDSQGYLFDRLRDDLSESGHELLNPPGVQGWDEDLAWMADQWVLSRIRALGRMLEMDHGPDRTPGLPYHLLPPQAQWNDRDVRGRIVDALAAVFHLDLTDAERDIYIEVLDQNGYRAFHLTDPNDRPRHVFEVIRLMAMDERVLGR